MQFKLENEHLEACFVAKGAELQSLVNKQNQVNYLWEGNPDYWGKHSPILFPIVGGLKNDTYYHNDVAYQLPRHGFARDLEFDVQQVSDTKVVFTLQESQATLAVYPFRFRLAVRYILNGNTLNCSYEVENPANETLLFSIGGHPAFAVPLSENLDYADYSLHFNEDEKLVYYPLVGNLIGEQTAEIQLNGGVLPLQRQLFYNDALVFKSLKSNEIAVLSKKDGRGLQFSFERFPFFGIWAAKDANFVCLEPWCGIADGVNHNQVLADKESVVKLASGEVFSRTWQAKVI